MYTRGVSSRAKGKSLCNPEAAPTGLKNRLNSGTGTCLLNRHIVAVRQTSCPGVAGDDFPVNPGTGNVLLNRRPAAGFQNVLVRLSPTPSG